MPEVELHGSCASRFQPVADAFRANFALGKECGASLALVQRGEVVLDLWAGHADAERTRPWEGDTLVNVFSTTKMATALAVLHLADRGGLDLDAPLCRYWPGFAGQGREQVLVRHVLCHTAGMPGFSARVAFADLLDWEKVIHLLENQKPRWKPGKRLAYHTLTYGYLLGEVVRRITGRTLGTYLRQEITAPLGIDFHIGLPATEEPRAAEILPPQDPLSPLLLGLGKALYPLAMKIAANPPLDGRNFDTPACRRAEIPAGNGMGNARSVALLGAILAGGGVFRGARVLSPGMLERMLALHSSGRDPVALGRDSAWGLGVMLRHKDFLLGPRSFYATGLGGSVCVMDDRCGVSFAYVMNRMAEFVEGDARSLPLVRAMWACLGEEQQDA